MKKILYLNHKPSQCGVYDFGQSTGEVLPASQKFQFIYAEVSSAAEAHAEVVKHEPQAILLNWHPSTMPWLRDAVASAWCRPIGTSCHDACYPAITHAHLHLDPTFPECWEHFRIGRLIPKYEAPDQPPHEVPVIGSFGFGFGHKGFHRLVGLVNQEFDSAVIRLHMAAATFGDTEGGSARQLADLCRVTCKPGITLEVTHDYMSRPELLDWLAGNTVNCFLYDTMYATRGIASVADLALAVRRPIAISQSWGFRHMTVAKDLISIEASSLRDIIARGNEPLKQFQEAWTDLNLIRDYERVAEFLTRAS